MALAFKLDKDSRAQRDELLAALVAERDAVQAAFTVLETEVQAALDTYNAAVNSYNVAVSNAYEFAGDQASAFREEWDRKSDKWQEGERGSALNVRVEEWEGFDDALAEVLDMPDLEAPDFAATDAFEELPMDLSAGS